MKLCDVLCIWGTQNPIDDPQAASWMSALQAVVWKFEWTSCLLKGMLGGAEYCVGF